jgi:signal recognition particle receptor subunit beta
MPNINYAFREIACKIVYYGPGFGGKTTNLQFVHSNVPEKHRGQLVSLATEQDQTLFFDFLPLDVGDVKGFKTKFQLYTVPGQVFYNATRKLVLRGVDGIVFVADSQADRLQDNIESFRNLQDNLREYGLSLDRIPLVMQYNKRDLPNAMPLEELRQYLNPEGRFAEFEAVATEGIGVRETLREVASQVLTVLKENANIIMDETIIGERLGVLPTAGEDDEQKGGRSHRAGERGPSIETSQISRWHWRGIAVGSGTVAITTIEAEDGSTVYNFVADYRIFGIKKNMSRQLKYIGEDRREFFGIEHSYHYLRDTVTSRESVPISVYVEKGGIPRVYVIYPGIAGDIKVGPPGEAMPF